MNRNCLQTGISVTLMLIGITFVLAAALFGARYALSNSLVSDPTYLESTIVPTFRVPSTFMESEATSTSPQSSNVLGQEGSGEKLNNPSSKNAAQAAGSGDLALPIAGFPALVQPALDADDPPSSETSQAGTIPPKDNAQGSIATTPAPQAEATQETGIIQAETPAESTPVPEGMPETSPEAEEQPPITETVSNTEEAEEQEQEPPTETQALPDDGESSQNEQTGVQPPAGDAPSPPAPRPEAQPVVRVKIPKLKVERAIVPIGWTRKGWDTDPLFATKNRPDLVGHLEGSTYPGEGGNIVLVGHNFDWGIYQWYGVFSNLKSLNPGDKIKLYTKDGAEYVYFVELVKVVPFSNGNAKEMARHYKFIGLKNEETLTLVTCGGANFWFWNKRVYVVAQPAG